MGNSFYGGQDARPFIIKNKFNSVAEMVEKFELGLSYLDVNFEEYVLIDCHNKNNPENGMIFRRGYDVNSNRYITSYTPVPINENDSEAIVKFTENPKTLAYGAEYIGTIVGPAGGAPLVKMYDGFTEIPTIPKDAYNGVNLEGGEIITLSQGNGLVSGKDTDDIQWKYYSLRTKNNESTTLHIGFKVPYPVFEMSANHISPYDSNGNIVDYSNGELVTDNASNRFYYKDWKLSIPKGIKGDSIAVELIGDTDKNNQQLKFTTTKYDKKEEGESTSQFFDYNIIDTIKLSGQGSLTIGQTAREDYVSGNVINWINKIQFDDTKGIFTFISNNGNIDYTNKDKPIIWPTSISLENNGDFIITYNNTEAKPTSTLNSLTWITEIDFDENGKFTIDFNNNKVANGQFTNSNNLINWITDATISEDGILNFIFNNNIIEENGEKTNVLSRTINWINSISFLESGLFTISMANEQGIEGEVYDDNSIQRWITWIKDISLNDNGLLKIVFNNNTINTGNKDSAGRSVLQKELNWVESASMSDSGLLKIDFVNNNGITVNDSKYPNSITQQITSLSNIYLNEFGEFGYKLNTGDEASIQIPIIESANITKGILTIGFKNGDSIEATGSLKQINSITHDAQNGKLNFTYNDGNTDQVDFPQNFYISNINNTPSSAPSGSLWAITESKGGN